MRIVSRRQFLKSSVAISGSLLLLPSCGSPRKDEEGNKYVIAQTTYGKV
ncbi:MAG: twin-arginine translocation signal domain-containing protein, partial [Bacteroidales bacterium]|nr:twin-arginine translocation signal domain-containing protein [Bacteroidales bacterium]